MNKAREPHGKEQKIVSGQPPVRKWGPQSNTLKELNPDNHMSLEVNPFLVNPSDESTVQVNQYLEANLMRDSEAEDPDKLGLYSWDNKFVLF